MINNVQFQDNNDSEVKVAAKVFPADTQNVMANTSLLAAQRVADVLDSMDAFYNELKLSKKYIHNFSLLLTKTNVSYPVDLWSVAAKVIFLYLLLVYKLIYSYKTILFYLNVNPTKTIIIVC